MKRMIALLAAIMAMAAMEVAQADGTSVPGLHSYRLDNGLELFVLENHAVPLTRIQITFRCGSITGRPETTGLFHLYEHMLFKGNSRYKTETEFSAAMTDLGVAEWNGGTSTEYVTYYFTVPSNKTEAGLQFWSYAMREPLLDPAELEIEQGVVSNEINGYLSDPDRVYSAAMDKALFPKFPWRRDIGGSEKIVRSATVETLRDIQSAYYIPNNAALFVGGDVDPAQIFAMVRTWYGTWKPGADPWKTPPPPHPIPANPNPVLLAFPDESLPQGIAYLEMRYRGPDVVMDPAPTYAADVWGYLIQSPAGRFKTTIFDKVPGLYDKDYIGGYYYTQRDGGQVSFYTYCFVDPANPLASRAVTSFRDAVVAGEITAMISDSSYFPDGAFTIVKQKMEDEQILNLETPEKFIATLSFWWAVASTDYFFKYVPTMQNVQRSDISSFLGRFVLSNVPVIAVRVNPTDFEAEAGSLAKAGFVTVNADNAFWWKEGK
jgi:zinc protease